MAISIDYNKDIVYEIDIDFHNKTQLSNVYSKQYDENTKYIVASVWKNGEEYIIPSGTTLMFCSTKPSGKGIADTENCAIIDNKLIYKISYQATVENGSFLAEFRLLNNVENEQRLISSPKFKMFVEPSALSDGTVISSEEFNVLSGLIDDAKEAIKDLGDIAQTEAIRIASEDARKSAEVTRISQENTRKTQESTRETNENTRKSTESIRVSAESTRITTETGRVNAETLRVTDENTRKTNETGRVNAESVRVSSENTRVTNENERKTAETTRKTDETARKASESLRVTDESTRKTNEDSRKATELTRASNETTRTTDEASRKSAEALRVSDENTRKTNEDGRKSTELLRVGDENTRKTNETTRQNNENQRKIYHDNFIIWDDEYIPSKTYKVGNKVQYGGSSYICTVDAQGVVPTNKSYWALFAAKGLDGLGSGDMHTLDYDKNNNGKVDIAEVAELAESVPWSGIIEKPIVFLPSAHSHTKSQITDFPTSLPASGGDAATVNGKTVKSDVPANAKFTDTVTTLNGKTGAISKADIVALGIPSQDTVFVHPNNADTRHVSDTEKANWNGKVSKSTTTNVSLTPATWTGTTAPFSYTLPVTGATATNVIELLPQASITPAQVESLAGAQIVTATQTTNSITLKAFGDKPEIDLPITVIVRRDL